MDFLSAHQQLIVEIRFLLVSEKENGAIYLIPLIMIFGDFVCSIYVLVNILRKHFILQWPWQYFCPPTSAAAWLPSSWGEIYSPLQGTSSDPSHV